MPELSKFSYERTFKYSVMWWFLESLGSVIETKCRQLVRAGLLQGQQVTLLGLPALQAVLRTAINHSQEIVARIQESFAICQLWVDDVLGSLRFLYEF